MYTKQKTVLLDLGGVVFNSTGRTDSKIDWEKISFLNNKYGHQLNIGESVFPDFLTEYNELTRQTLNGDEFLSAVFDTLEFNAGLVDAVKKSYQIIIVSDNYRENIAYISKRYAFSDWSENQFYSYDFEMVKSRPDFFKLLLEKLQMDPGQLVLIDDSEDNLRNARNNKIRTIRFQNNPQTIKELNALIW